MNPQAISRNNADEHHVLRSPHGVGQASRLSPCRTTRGAFRSHCPADDHPGKLQQGAVRDRRDACPTGWLQRGSLYGGGLFACLLLASALALPAAQPGVPERLAAIAKEMKSPDKEVRLKAVGQLIHFAGGQELALPALPHLREAMKDASPEVRAVACTATGNFHAQAKVAVPDLVKLLRDTDAEVRQTAVRALGRVGADAKGALKDMGRSTSDEDAVVRVVAHAAMIHVGAPVAEHLPAVLKGMEDSSAVVRYKSAHCLESLDAVAAPGVAKLGTLLTDPDTKVRHYSARALARLGETARPALAALQAAREKETDASNKGLMDSAIRNLAK